MKTWIRKCKWIPNISQPLSNHLSCLFQFSSICYIHMNTYTVAHDRLSSFVVHLSHVFPVCWCAARLRLGSLPLPAPEAAYLKFASGSSHVFVKDCQMLLSRNGEYSWMQPHVFLFASVETVVPWHCFQAEVKKKDSSSIATMLSYVQHSASSATIPKMFKEESHLRSPKWSPFNHGFMAACV